MLNFKEKIEIVKKLKKEKLDLAEIDKYLDYLSQESLVKLVFKKLVIALIDLDVELYSLYESISDEDWNDIVSEIETPIENPSYGCIREKIRVFINTYKKIDEKIKYININVLLDCLSLIPYNRTSSVQFLLFRLGTQKCNPVLSFLFDNLKTNPIVYVPFFVSFVTRCRVNSKSAVLQYIKYLESLKPGNYTNYVLIAQGLMYICCFKREYFEVCKNIFKIIFENNIYVFMNPNVVEKFISFYFFETKYFRTLDNSSLFYFPFDKSIFESIHELYETMYCEFV